MKASRYYFRGNLPIIYGVYYHRYLFLIAIDLFQIQIQIFLKNCSVLCQIVLAQCNILDLMRLA